MARKYRIVTLQIKGPDAPETLGCNAIVFVNRGTNDAYINDETLETGQSIVNAGLNDEQDMTQYKVSFEAAGGTNDVYCRFKIYVDN